MRDMAATRGEPSSIGLLLCTAGQQFNSSSLFSQLKLPELFLDLCLHLFVICSTLADLRVPICFSYTKTVQFSQNIFS
jgi:hypothetical protein